MKQILLITTKGCKGCSIMHQLVTDALDSISNKNIEFVEKDVETVDKKWLFTNKIFDFPTVLFINSDIITFKYTGTMPAPVIIRWIKLYLK